MTTISLCLLLLNSCKQQDYVCKNDYFDGKKIEYCFHKDSNYVVHYIVYDENEKLFKRYKLINKKKEGIEKQYYPNGNVLYEATFANDTLNGISNWYYDNELNSLEAKYYYEKGKSVGNQISFYKNGIIKDYLSLDYSGGVVLKINYDKNGNITSEDGNYKVLGWFNKRRFYKGDSLTYKAYIALPEKRKVSYFISFTLDEEAEDWIQINPKDIIDFKKIFLEEGKYVLKERLKIHNVEGNLVKEENYSINFLINDK